MVFPSHPLVVAVLEEVAEEEDVRPSSSAGHLALVHLEP